MKPMSPKGISWLKDNQKWRADTCILGKQYHISFSTSEKDAIADRAKVEEQMQAIEEVASGIADEKDRARHVRKQIGELVGRDEKTS